MFYKTFRRNFTRVSKNLTIFLESLENVVYRLIVHIIVKYSPIASQDRSGILKKNSNVYLNKIYILNFCKKKKIVIFYKQLKLSNKKCPK